MSPRLISKFLVSWEVGVMTSMHERKLALFQGVCPLRVFSSRPIIIPELIPDMNRADEEVDG